VPEKGKASAYKATARDIAAQKVAAHRTPLHMAAELAAVPGMTVQDKASLRWSDFEAALPNLGFGCWWKGAGHPYHRGENER
jgi:hypothetical protein